MSQIKIKEGDRVNVILDSELKTGVVSSIFDTMTNPIAIVTIGDESFKACIDNLAPVKDPVEEPKKTDAIEITPEEFKSISLATIIDMDIPDMIIGGLIASYAGSLHSQLFSVEDPVEND